MKCAGGVLSGGGDFDGRRKSGLEGNSNGNACCASFSCEYPFYPGLLAMTMFDSVAFVVVRTSFA